MKSTCHCGKPAQTSLSYRFTSPTGYKCATEIHTCEDCGPTALREAAGQLQAWADVMESSHAGDPSRFLFRARRLADKGSNRLLNPPLDWMPTEEDWNKFAMILDDSRLKHAREHCKPGDKFLWRYLVLWGNRSPEPKENRDVHTEHCCTVHGCKYVDDDCPVVTKKKVQSSYCEECGLELEGYYDERTE